MSELTVIRGPARGTSITLSADRVFTIGTAPDAAVRVAGDDVAEQHVVVKALKDGGYGVKGIAGPFLHNGRPVEVARLRDGDELEIGDTKLRYGVEARATEHPRELGGFRILGVLGKGGMGIVYRAEQKSLGREVALKVLSRERTSDPVFVGRFQAEARAAARLHHPNVVQVFDVDHDGDTWFYSMELMHQGSLEQRLRRDGKIPVEEAVRLVLDAARGLAFAESMRIVHCDIKPDNLMVDRHGNVKLADLGLALVDDDGSGKVAGTPHFMSPEQVQRKPLDHRSDLYSLGCTFYRLVTGRTPFTGDSVKQILLGHVKHEPVPANKVDPSVPSELAEVIDRLLRKDPDERFGSAEELVARLEALLTPPARRGALVAAIVGALAIAGGAVGWALSRPEPEPVEPTERIVEVTDERAAEEARKLAAENALLNVQLSGLAGLPLAEAYEAMAREHPDTAAAESARKLAEAVRAEVRAAEAEEARRRAAVDAACEALRTAVTEALGRSDFPAALAAVDGSPENPLAQDAEALESLREKLAAEVRDAAGRHVATLQGEVDRALSARDAEAAGRALAALRAVVAEEGGWPKGLFDDRTAVEQAVGTAAERVAELEAAIADAAERAAWRTAAGALFGSDGAFAAIEDFDLQGAAGALEALAAAHPGSTAAARAAALVPALRRAAEWLDAFRTAAGAGELVVRHDGADLVVQGFEIGGDAAGLRIKPDPRRRTEEIVPPETLRAEPEKWFPCFEPATAGDRAAFLALLRWAEQGRHARHYLARLRPEDDATGTGEQGYPTGTDAITTVLEQLAEADAEWAEPLRRELRAAQLLARGFRALSARRNTTAGGLLEQLLADHGSTVLVGVLK